MQGYILDGEIYCEKCGETMVANGLPMGELLDIGPSDGMEHCQKGPDCLNPTIIDEQICGCFLENDLTEKGIRDLRELMFGGVNPVIEFWVRHYNSHGYSI